VAKHSKLANTKFVFVNLLLCTADLFGKKVSAAQKSALQFFVHEKTLQNEKRAKKINRTKLVFLLCGDDFFCKRSALQPFVHSKIRNGLTLENV